MSNSRKINTTKNTKNTKAFSSGRKRKSKDNLDELNDDLANLLDDVIPNTTKKTRIKERANYKKDSSQESDEESTLSGEDWASNGEDLSSKEQTEEASKVLVDVEKEKKNKDYHKK